MLRSLTNICTCNYFPANPVMTYIQKPAIAYPLKKNEFDDYFWMNFAEWLFFRSLSCACSLTLPSANSRTSVSLRNRGIQRSINDALTFLSDSLWLFTGSKAFCRWRCQMVLTWNPQWFANISSGIMYP